MHTSQFQGCQEVGAQLKWTMVQQVSQSTNMPLQFSEGWIFDLDGLVLRQQLIVQR